MKHIFNESTLAKIIDTLVISKINYSSSVWSNTSDMNTKKVQLIQNCLITGLSKYDHISSTLESLNWLPIKEHLLYRDTIVTFKCINGLAPSYTFVTNLKKEMKSMTAIPGTIKSFKFHNIVHVGKERSNIERLRYGMRWMNN